MTDQTVSESGLIVPVPASSALIHRHRLRFDPSASAGAPEHITLLYPFLAPAGLDRGVSVRLEALFGEIHPFPFALSATAWFGQDVLYLAPHPSAAFTRLTKLLSDEFGVLPYGGRFGDATPHLTIGATSGQGGDPLALLQHVATDIAGHLPIEAIAREAWLMVGSNEAGWSVRDQFPFAPG